MKFFIFFFKKLIFRASVKMHQNLFFLKLNIHLLATTILYPHIFNSFNNKLKVKVFKFNLTTVFFKYLYLLLFLSVFISLIFFFI